MKADCIKDIIESYGKSPYECILIDGPWGVGKSYAVEDALNSNNSCNISMFGMKDAREIYHEVFFQLVMKDKIGYSSFLSKVKDVCAMLSKKIDTIKKIVESLVTEKELFLNISKSFNSYHFIVIDDLERMNDSIKIEEVFGIIDELKRCNYVKVIVVANTKEMSQKERFDKYSEKVIDRTYYITERPEKVDWAELRIHHDFIMNFLNLHQVKNLRTLQKAQNLYDDVRLKLRDGYRDEFYDEIRLACFAIVVESIDNLYADFGIVPMIPRYVALRAYLFNYQEDSINANRVLDEYRYHLENISERKLKEKYTALELIHMYYKYEEDNINFWLEQPRQMLNALSSYERVLEQKDKNIFYVEVEDDRNE